MHGIFSQMVYLLVKSFYDPLSGHRRGSSWWAYLRKIRASPRVLTLCWMEALSVNDCSLRIQDSE